jgi:mannonate dehydratase
MRCAWSRRSVLQGAGTAALLAPSKAAAAGRLGMPAEGPGTPKITLWLQDLEEATLRRVQQLGVNYVCMGGPPIPWQEGEIRARMERLRAHGMTLFMMMFGGFPNAIYGRPGRDEDIEKVIQSIRASARAGLRVMEYNFYAHRAVEGYYEEIGRGGAGLVAFDYRKIKDLPPLPEVGAHSLDEMWSNVTYFLKAVVPVAHETGVRLALHPNDPPAPVSRGSGQIMGSVEGWKRLVEIVPSPSNGITFDCEVTREMGHDPVEVCRYFGQRDTINHMHFRNVRMRVAREQYTEVFLDEGEVDMFAVMRELVRQKYPRLIYPEHPPHIDADREHPFRGISSQRYTGFAYTTGYARAMLQAALSL